MDGMTKAILTSRRNQFCWEEGDWISPVMKEKSNGKRTDAMPVVRKVEGEGRRILRVNLGQSQEVRPG